MSAGEWLLFAYHRVDGLPCLMMTAQRSAQRPLAGSPFSYVEIRWCASCVCVCRFLSRRRFSYGVEFSALRWSSISSSVSSLPPAGVSSPPTGVSRRFHLRWGSGDYPIRTPLSRLRAFSGCGSACQGSRRGPHQKPKDLLWGLSYFFSWCRLTGKGFGEQCSDLQSGQRVRGTAAATGFNSAVIKHD